MAEREWLDSLKPGDQVLVGGSIGKVERLTKKWVVVSLKSSTHNFRLSDGWSVSGGSWNRTYLSPLTEDKKREIYHKRRVSRLRAYDYGTLPEELVLELYAKIREYEQSKVAGIDVSAANCKGD